MKKTFIILFCSLVLFSCEQAPLIEDYKIEGISLGDSLLDLMTEGEIKKDIIKSKVMYDYRGDDFAQINLNKGLKTYEELNFFIKPNDSKYIIYAIFGDLYFSNIDLCFKKQNKISEEFTNKYKDTEKTNGNKKFEGGEFRYIYFDFKSGDRIGIQCYKYYKDDSNSLAISLSKKDVITWGSIWKQ